MGSPRASISAVYGMCIRVYPLRSNASHCWICSAFFCSERSTTVSRQLVDCHPVQPRRPLSGGDWVTFFRQLQGSLFVREPFGAVWLLVIRVAEPQPLLKIKQWWLVRQIKTSWCFMTHDWNSLVCVMSRLMRTAERMKKTWNSVRMRET